MHCAEKRFNRRHDIDFTAYLMWNGRLIEANAINISLQGMLLGCTGLSCPAGVEIKICCIVSRRYYEMTSTIVHIGSGLIGVIFNSPQPAFHQAALMRALNGRMLMTA